MCGPLESGEEAINGSLRNPIPLHSQRGLSMTDEVRAGLGIIGADDAWAFELTKNMVGKDLVDRNGSMMLSTAVLLWSKRICLFSHVHYVPTSMLKGIIAVGMK